MFYPSSELIKIKVTFVFILKRVKFAENYSTSHYTLLIPNFTLYIIEKIRQLIDRIDTSNFLFVSEKLTLENTPYFYLNYFQIEIAHLSII